MHINNYYKVGYLEDGDGKLRRNLLLTSSRRGFVFHNGISGCAARFMKFVTSHKITKIENWGLLWLPSSCAPVTTV